jgi:hypothetical protein
MSVTKSLFWLVILSSCNAFAAVVQAQSCPANSTLQQRNGKPFCKCNNGYVIGPRLSCIDQPTFNLNWDTSPQSQSEKQVVQHLLQRVKNRTAANLITAYVEFKRGTPDLAWPEASASQGRVMVNGRFFVTGTSPDYQLSLLLFEAGKVLADVVDKGPAVQRPKFAEFLDTHRGLLLALRHARLNSQSLANVSDPDSYSVVGFAFRALALDLNLPHEPPAGFEVNEWNNFRQQWPEAKLQFEAELARLSR